MSHRGSAAGLLLVAFALTGCGSSGNTLAQDPGTQAPTGTSSTAPSSSAPSSSSPAAPETSASSTESAAQPRAAGTLITLDEPTDRASVSGTFKASGMANSPEANVPWQILDSHGAKVLNGAFTAEGWMDKLYPFHGSVDVSSLAPGSYTFVVSISDQSDGEGTPPQKVSRAISVS